MTGAKRGVRAGVFLMCREMMAGCWTGWPLQRRFDGGSLCREAPGLSFGGRVPCIIGLKAVSLEGSGIPACLDCFECFDRCF